MKSFMLSLTLFFGIFFIGNAVLAGGSSTTTNTSNNSCYEHCDIMRQVMIEGMGPGVDNNNTIQNYFSNCMHCCTHYGECGLSK